MTYDKLPNVIAEFWHAEDGRVGDDAMARPSTGMEPKQLLWSDVI